MFGKHRGSSRDLIGDGASLGDASCGEGFGQTFPFFSKINYKLLFRNGLRIKKCYIIKQKSEIS